ncbi:MAG: hypothetical protein V2I54_02050 [Bacteroidales bacterium]|jgi:hypothetical protein|nr:hypothetical protein [Bacteroidales bacterium]
MKSFVFVLALMGFSFFVKAQVILPDDPDTTKTDTVNQKEILSEENNSEAPETDVIYLHDKTVMRVHVKKIYQNDLFYSLPGETKVNQMDQRLVHKIEYKSGQMEVLNEEPQTVRNINDYRKVKVTYDADDVEGMVEVAKLEAKAEGSDRGYYTAKSLERSATIILRRKAALVNAEMVLITDKKVHVAFGEIPFTILYGTAYSYR